MSPFQDVEQFARQHRSCGSLTPSISSPAKGGYLLTVTCSCGQSFDRWVSEEEAKLEGAQAAGSVPAEPSSGSPPPPSRATGRPPGAETAAARAAEPVSRTEAPAPVGARRTATEMPPPGAPDDAGKRGAPPTLTRPAVQDARPTPPGGFDAEPRKPGTGTAAAAGARPAPRGATLTEPITTGPKPKLHARTATVGLAIALVILAAGVGVWQYLARSPSSPDLLASSGPPSTARPPLGDTERASVDGALTALRELQAVSRVEVPSRIYLTRVAGTKVDLERTLAAVNDPDLRNALNDALTMHLLAAKAWKAKTLNERDKWEAVGDDAAVEQCPAAKRVVAVADEPPGMSRSQWRGVALAAAIPLLWDCAASRMAELERALRDR